MNIILSLTDGSVQISHLPLPINRPQGEEVGDSLLWYSCISLVHCSLVSSSSKSSSPPICLGFLNPNSGAQHDFLRDTKVQDYHNKNSFSKDRSR
jgi:hypothetical protein